MGKPSVIVLGSKPGSVAALALLLHRGWDVRHVVASEKNDFEWLPKPALREFALSNNLTVFEAQGLLPAETTADFVISYMCRNRVDARTRSMASRAALNFHAGPLPEFGGWAFYNVALLEGAKEYGCTCHYMDDGFDTGPLLKVARFPIKPDEETALSLEGKAQEEMVRLFLEFCEMAEAGRPLPLIHQDPLRMRYMKREEFESLKEIPIGAHPHDIDRRARAFWYPPYTCAYMNIGGNRVEIVPQLAKDQIAGDVHAKDLRELLAVVGLSASSLRTGP